jgi:HlyD family secretion protein
MALLALGVLLIVLIVWSVIGEISIKVQGKGILIRGDALLEVTSGSDGRVIEILVQENETVRVGDLIARLSQPQLDEKIRNKESELAGLIAQVSSERQAQASIINRLNSESAELRRKVVTQQEAVERGLLTNSSLLQTKEQLTNKDTQIANIRSGLGEKQGRIDGVRRELSELRSQLGTTAEVLSAYDGRVIEIATHEGDLLTPGTTVVTLEAFEEPIDAVIYIPAADGKKVKPGMMAQISPSTVKQEEWGFIIGEVSSVSEFPVTPEGLKKVLRNEQLVQDLAGKSAPFEIKVTLLTADTDSGFQWSSSAGPPQKVFSGTVCSANVTVEKKKPISYVIPIFKSTLGM